MRLIESRKLKQQTMQQLSEASYDPKRLALIHAGIALAFSLVLTVINYLLSSGIAGTGGLDGIRTRSILMSAQSVLSLVLTVGMPFWEYGFVAAAMGYARKEQVSPRDLTRGFRQFGPLLRLMLLEAVLYMLIALLASQIASIVVAMTPLGNGTMEILETIEQSPQFRQNGVLPEEMLLPLMQSMIPAFVGTGVLFVLIAVPVSYWLRLTRYMVLDGPRPRVLMAMLLSRQIMRGNCMDYFKLDLSFWWYWLLQAGCSVLAFGDVLLPLIGVALPMSPEVSAFLFYGLKLVASLLLAWRWRGPVETTYALAYDTLTGKYKETPQVQ